MKQALPSVKISVACCILLALAIAGFFILHFYPSTKATNILEYCAQPLQQDLSIDSIYIPGAKRSAGLYTLGSPAFSSKYEMCFNTSLSYEEVERIVTRKLEEAGFAYRDKIDRNDEYGKHVIWTSYNIDDKWYAALLYYNLSNVADKDILWLHEGSDKEGYKLVIDELE